MRGYRLGLAALSCAGVLAVAGCGTGNSDKDSGGGGNSDSVKGGPGVNLKAKTIRIIDLSAISGPAGALGKPTTAGARSAVREINAAGGVEGFKLKFVVKDTGYVPQNHVKAYKANADKAAILQSFGSPTTKAIQPLFDQDNLVVQPLSWDSVWSKDPHLAPLGVPYATDITNGLHYLTKTKKLGTKVGILYQDDEFGADGLRGYKAGVKNDSLDDVAKVTYKPGDTDFTSQVSKLKSSGAQIVAITALPSAVGPFIGTAASLGYNPIFLFQGPAWFEPLFTADGTLHGKKTPLAGPLAKSTYVLTFAAPWGSDVPGMKDMLAAQKKYAPKQFPSQYFTIGYAQIKVIQAILEKAIKNGDLSRAGILKAKESLSSVDLGGLAPDPNYQQSGGPVSDKSIIARITDGRAGFLKTVTSDAGS